MLSEVDGVLLEKPVGLIQVVQINFHLVQISLALCFVIGRVSVGALVAMLHFKKFEYFEL